MKTPIKKLKAEYKELWHTVEIVGCYGWKDQYRLDALERELYSRGWVANERRTVIFERR